MTHAIGLTLLAALQTTASPPLDAAGARLVFDEAARIAAVDGKRLWGRSLAGPMLLVDPESRRLMANRPDGLQLLTPAGDVFTGTLPAEMGPANTAVTFAGQRWTMLMWPLPADSANRRQLLAHEMWHRIQDSIGLASRETPNPQVDDEIGRSLLRLEARALAKALGAKGVDLTTALVTALSFRAERYRHYAGADAAEAGLERNEGLAEYTGLRLSGRSLAGQRRQAIAELQALEAKDHLARSFAYTTGPAYGLLLDQVRPGWRLELAGGAGPSALARRAVGVDLFDGARLAAEERRLGGELVRAEEAKRAEATKVRRRDLVGRFAIGPVLILPLEKSGFSFDPGTVESLDTLGTYYGRLELTGEWGTLDAKSGGALIWPGFRRATVALSAGFKPERRLDVGWSLDLKPEWRIVADSAPGRWRVERAVKPAP